MTWPAPDLPINFTNATQSLDTHPSAHNTTNLSLNDDYRPELTRVGGEIDNIQAQVILTGKSNDIELVTDGQIEHRDSANALRGVIPAYRTTLQSSTTADAFSSGTSPVEYHRVTYNGTFPAGGRVTVTVWAVARFNTAAASCVLTAGASFSGAAVDYVTSVNETGGDLRQSGAQFNLMSVYDWAIPAGATSVAGVIGVRDAGTPWLVAQGAARIVVESY